MNKLSLIVALGLTLAAVSDTAARHGRHGGGGCGGGYGGGYGGYYGGCGGYAGGFYGGHYGHGGMYGSGYYAPSGYASSPYYYGNTSAYPSGSMTTPDPPPSMLAEKTATTAGRTLATTSTRRASACLTADRSAAAAPPESARVVAVAGIARPERFFDALRRQGHEVVREQVFPDHHWFTAADVRKVEREAQESVVDCVVTTAKDAVRLERHRSAMSLPWAILPMTVTIEPGAEFETWLRQYL